VKSAAIAVLLLVADRSARGEDAATLDGLYVCEAGCRVTDAAPSVQIEGDVALCTNELGGLFRGKRLSATTLACFNKIGALSADGAHIVWNSGMVWRRAPR
jgi:hypothetical protein